MGMWGCADLLGRWGRDGRVRHGGDHFRRDILLDHSLAGAGNDISSGCAEGAGSARAEWR